MGGAGVLKRSLAMQSVRGRELELIVHACLVDNVKAIPQRD